MPFYTQPDKFSTILEKFIFSLFCAVRCLSKEGIKRAFSKSAPGYDQACDFQKDSGVQLIDMIIKDRCAKGILLDIGMGTGSTTKRLCKTPTAVVYGCDIAWGMVRFSKEKTRNIFVTQADAQMLPYRTGAFDIVFSNIAHQWVEDYSLAFLEIKRVLKKKGRFYFSILVKGSLKELYETIEKTLNRSIFSDFLPESDRIESDIKNAGLCVNWVEKRSFKKDYQSSIELLKSLKKVGAGRVTEEGLFGMGKSRLFSEMLREYDKKFSRNGKIFANYKVMMGCVEKT